MPTTLITGANGFVGATMVDTALAHQHTVVLAVRSLSSGPPLLSANPTWDQSRITFISVPDFTAPGAFDTAFQERQFDYVLHIAAPVLDNPDNTDFVEHFEKPSVQGNLELLQSGKKYGKNLKAIAVTGSINAITTGMDVKERVYDDGEWLPLSRDDAIGSGNPYIMYCVGKKVAEQAIWKFIEEEKPNFTVTNFNPALIFGPPKQAVRSMDKLNFSTNLIWSILSGKEKLTPSTAFPGYIDVRDLAELHLAALTNPAAANKRFVVARKMLFNNLVDSMKGLDLPYGLPAKNDEGDESPLRADMGPLDKVFGLKYRTLEQTTHDAANKLVELDKGFKK